MCQYGPPVRLKKSRSVFRSASMGSSAGVDRSNGQERCVLGGHSRQEKAHSIRIRLEFVVQWPDLARAPQPEKMSTHAIGVPGCSSTPSFDRPRQWDERSAQPARRVFEASSACTAESLWQPIVDVSAAAHRVRVRCATSSLKMKQIGALHRQKQSCGFHLRPPPRKSSPQ